MTPNTEMPSEAAARSLVRTAMSRRPVRDRRRLATSSARSTKQTRLTAAQACGWLKASTSMPNSFDPADAGAAVERVAEVVGVGEHDLGHEEAEAERDDGEVHAAGPQRGHGEDQARPGS